MKSDSRKTISDLWDEIFEKYRIEDLLKDHEKVEITADQIKQFKEPRLMTKFDTSESLPAIFKKNKLGILPISRGSYVIGKFNLYEPFPEIKESEKKIKYIDFPDSFETLKLDSITSEANALNAMSIAGILEVFLDEEQFFSTLSGRMKSNSFSFLIGNKNGKKLNIDVNNSQIEIDAGFENRNVVSLIEAKNVVHNDFLIRQLYYPYRTWNQKIQKPIRPVFVVYSNSVYRLLEYEFVDVKDYNSISLVQESFFSFENPTISLDEIIEVIKQVSIVKEPDVTFPQANDFDKVISLLEQVKEQPLTLSEISENFGFDIRQAAYYSSAAQYLDLVEKGKNENNQTVIILSPLGKRIFDYSYKKRQLLYADLILKHKVFYEVAKKTLECGRIPDSEYLIKKMKEHTKCENNTLVRRASTVKGWVLWILRLVND